MTWIDGFRPSSAIPMANVYPFAPLADANGDIA
jgi:hypothetical protein